MRIKVYRNIIFYITIDRMIGYMLMFLSINGAIYHAVFVDGAAGGLEVFCTCHLTALYLELV